MMSRADDALTTIAEDARFQRKGWDTYDGDPIDPRAIAAARKFLGYDWSVAPCPDGGIQLERHDSGIDIEITFDADGMMTDAYFKWTPRSASAAEIDVTEAT